MSANDTLPGLYSAPRDVTLNRFSSSLLAETDGNALLLPAPPTGFLWYVNGDLQTLVDPVTYTLYAGTDNTGVPIANDSLAAAQFGGNATDGTFLDAGAFLDTALYLETDAPLRTLFEVGLLSQAYFRAVTSDQLTAVYAPIELPTIPDGMVLRSPFKGWSEYYDYNPAWFLNGDGNADANLRFRVTRGALQFELDAYLQVGGKRYAAGVPQLPPLLPGDELEARVLAAPAGISRCGMLFVLAPQAGGF